MNLKNAISIAHRAVSSPHKLPDTDAEHLSVFLKMCVDASTHAPMSNHILSGRMALETTLANITENPFLQFATVNYPYAFTLFELRHWANLCSAMGYFHVRDDDNFISALEVALDGSNGGRAIKAVEIVDEHMAKYFGAVDMLSEPGRARTTAGVVALASIMGLRGFRIFPIQDPQYVVFGDEILARLTTSTIGFGVLVAKEEHK